MTRPTFPFRFLLRSGGLLLLALAVVAAACGDGDSEAGGEASTRAGGSAFPRTITDDSGARVTIEAAPQRIISYSPGATETLFAIGAGGRVVATDDFSDFPAQARDLPKLVYLSPDPEAALAHDPDLVLMAVAQREQLQQFRDLGMTALFVEEADSIEGIFDSILLLGEITGTAEQADALVGEMRRRIRAVSDAIAGVKSGPCVYFELDATLYSVAPDSFVGGMLSVLKARNIAEGAQTAFPQLSAEAVIAADPEVILLADAEFGESAETVGARPGWAGISAVRNGRIFAIDPDTSNRPGPRIVEAIEAMARALYADRFE